MRTMHPLAEDYLSRLELAARALPPHDRDELLAELRSHLESGLADGASDADVRNMIQELGTPEDIVAAAQSGADDAPVTGGAPETGGAPMPGSAPPSPAFPPPSPWGTLEIIAVLSLTVGTFVVPIVGPIVGIILVWASTQWTSREKTVATALTLLPAVVLVLGGLALVVTSSGSGGEGSSPVPTMSVVPTGGTP
jgi:hypothetical protein